MNLKPLLFTSALSLVSACNLSAKPIQLAEGKAAQLPIVVSQTAITAEQTAAKELKEYLQKISGAEFAIVQEPDFKGGPAIYVGWTEFAKKQGLDFATFGEEESLLKTVDKSVIVGGGRPRGTLYAAYDLLERDLGVRWYTPWQETVPQKASLTLQETDRRFQPAFEFRWNNAFNGSYPFLKGVKLPDNIPTPGRMDTVRWMARNRLNVGLKYITSVEPGGKWIEWPEEYGGAVVTKNPSNHSFQYFIPDDKYFKTHPEFFSLRDGKRVKQGDHSTGLGLNHLCLSNPELPKVFAENVIKWIKENPDAYYVSIVPNDASRPMCDCEECKKIALKYMPPGTNRDNQHEAGLVLQFVNQVAEIVCKEFPKQRILTLSYNFSSAPPVGIKAHPNVIVQMCGGGMSSGLRINPNVPDSKKDLARYAGWEEVSKRLWVWDYQCGQTSSMDNFKPLLWATDRMFKNLQKKGGYTGVFIEAEWNSPPVIPDYYELNTWLSAKLMCDPGVDADALIREYIKDVYGKAAPAMQALLDLKKSQLPLYPYRAVTFDFMQKAQALMAEAEKAAAGDSALLSRLADVRINLDLLALQYRHQLRTGYLASGGKPEDYPWPVATLRQRLLNTVDRARNCRRHSLLCGLNCRRNRRYNLHRAVQLYIQLMKHSIQQRSYLNFSYRFAARDPKHDVYPWKSRRDGGLPWEGFEKAAWLHHTTGVPVTWMVDSVALEQAGRRLAKFCDVYGDEIVLSLEAFAAQPIWKKFGIEQKAFGMRNYSRAELVKIMTCMRRYAQDVVGRDVRIGAGYWWNADVISAAEECGFEGLWGLCWDQQGIDGATHRGSPWFPYYASTSEFRAPSVGEKGLLLFPWYRADLGNAFLYDDHPPFTTHTGELTRWCLEYPRDYVNAMLSQAVLEAKTSPFSYTEFHLECDWFDSSGIFHDEEMSPATEVWAMQRACVQEAAAWKQFQIGPISDFLQWHREKFSRTTRHTLWWTDPLGQLPPLEFIADADALVVRDNGGNIVASQSYSGGLLGNADEGFLDRAGLRHQLAPEATLPAELLKRLRMNMGREEEILVQGVAHES